MTVSKLYTAEQFAAERFELPEGGRWCEVHEGRLVQLTPPSDEHGQAVFNLSRALGVYLQVSSVEQGYASFEQALVLRRRPDTVRCPAIAYFESDDRFSVLDEDVTERRPRLVVELASTNDRRRQMASRVLEYHTVGVEMVWVVDPMEHCVNLIPAGGRVQPFRRGHQLRCETILPGFAMSVDDVFAIPDWWLSSG